MIPACHLFPGLGGAPHLGDGTAVNMHVAVMMREPGTSDNKLNGGFPQQEDLIGEEGEGYCATQRKIFGEVRR